MNKYSDNLDVKVGFENIDVNTGVVATSPYVDMRDKDTVVFVAKSGDAWVAETLDMKLVQATDAVGTGKKDLSPAVELSVVPGGEKQYALDVAAEDLDVENGFTHVALEATSADVSENLLVSSCHCAGNYRHRYENRPAYDGVA